jgi:hypothetical protein
MEDKGSTSAEVVRLRDIWRRELKRLDKEREERFNRLFVAEDAILKKYEEQLTRSMKLDEAKRVREARDGLRKQPVQNASTTGKPDDAATAVTNAEPAPRLSPTMPKPDLEKIFVNTTWVSGAGTSWAFSPEGVGQRVGEKAGKTKRNAFAWKHLDNNTIQIDDKDASSDVWFIRFDTASDASYGKKRENLNLNLHTTITSAAGLEGKLAEGKLAVVSVDGSKVPFQNDSLPYTNRPYTLQNVPASQGRLKLLQQAGGPRHMERKVEVKSNGLVYVACAFDGVGRELGVPDQGALVKLGFQQTDFTFRAYKIVLKIYSKQVDGSFTLPASRAFCGFMLLGELE